MIMAIGDGRGEGNRRLSAVIKLNRENFAALSFAIPAGLQAPCFPIC